MTQPKWQTTLWEYTLEHLERVVVKIKLGTVLIFLYTIVTFLTGYYIGQREKTADILWFADKVRERTIQTTPGAQYALSGITYCFDQGNTYLAERKGQWVFQKKRSTPDRPAIGGDQ